MAWVISYTDDNTAPTELVNRAVEWDVAGCEKCSAQWRESKTLPITCEVCGTRGQLWLAYIQMSINYLRQGKIVLRESSWTPTPCADYGTP
jgi:hypothetical protein